MRPRHLSRRTLLAGGAAALTACSASGPSAGPPAPAPDSPEVVLLKGLIAEKERTIALYSALIGKGGEAAKLVPFRDRHQAHLNELRKHVPPTSAASPSAASPFPAPKASLTKLRDVERKAAAQRPRQLAAVSPGIAQIIASIGACEAAHAQALPRSL